MEIKKQDMIGIILILAIVVALGLAAPLLTKIQSNCTVESINKISCVDTVDKLKENK
ncbi:hypothetical protein [Abyssogena phaseoliformis symbiont]|uniref:hypothetical protein n=1 Tax=Abyssogena phaseoliformis symbiont TaxID=596095 RepID=UPI001CED9766|nr:hypothetical protein [Abyssogena phaseoliformis symbiont]MBW5288853.1 hypothetical protein [Candidatus Ruthia sp. Apha_13_S6]